MAKNKKRHSGSARTYQDMKRKEALLEKSLTDEALLPDKKGGRIISIIGAAVMFVAFLLIYAGTSMKLIPSLLIAFVFGAAAILLATYIAVRRNRAKALKELKK